MRRRTVAAVDEARFPKLRSATVNNVQYRFGHQVGRGAFSTVYRAMDEWAGSLVAKVYAEGSSEAVWRNEVAQLRRFRCPWVPYLHAVFQSEGETYLIMENGGPAVSLCEFDGAEQRQRAAMLVARGVLHALSMIHLREYLHGDVNPQNVLVTLDRASKPAGVKLIDFAFCRPVASLVGGLQNMNQWMPPPEFFDRTLAVVGPAIDIYHAAAVLLQILKGGPIDFGVDDIRRSRPQSDAHALGTPFGAALARALSPDPANRPSALELWRLLRSSALRPGSVS